MSVTPELDLDLRTAIRSIPDYPSAGHRLPRHHDACSADARAFRRAVDELVQPWAGQQDRQGRRHRSARLHPRWRRGASDLGRLRADPQEGQAAATRRSPSAIRSSTASTKWRCMRQRIEPTRLWVLRRLQQFLRPLGVANVPMKVPLVTRAVPKIDGADQDATGKVVASHVLDSVLLHHLGLLVGFVPTEGGVNVDSPPHVGQAVAVFLWASRLA